MPVVFWAVSDFIEYVGGFFRGSQSVPRTRFPRGKRSSMVVASRRTVSSVPWARCSMMGMATWGSFKPSAWAMAHDVTARS